MRGRSPLYRVYQSVSRSTGSVCRAGLGSTGTGTGTGTEVRAILVLVLVLVLVPKKLAPITTFARLAARRRPTNFSRILVKNRSKFRLRRSFFDEISPPAVNCLSNFGLRRLIFLSNFLLRLSIYEQISRHKYWR